MSGVPVVAIDGPAASGKSSTAGRVAARLGLVHIDSGALYRVATWLALESELDDPDAIVAALEAAAISMTREGSGVLIRMDGTAVEPAIRAPAVTARVSAVSAMPAVRAWVNARLRAGVLEWGGAVMDGRDIGTVVFPDAALKVFLTATPEARAVRRLRQAGGEVPDHEIAREAERLEARDRQDASRVEAPLRAAADARLLDTTRLGFEDQVAQIVAWARDAGLSDS